MYQQMVEDLELPVNQEALSLLANVSHVLDKRDVQAYLIGGFVRDMLLGRDAADIDIAVAADALETASEVAAALGGKYIPLDPVNGIGRVVLFDSASDSTKDRYELDFSTLRGTIEEDLAQRDFTIDAMAVSLGEAGYEPLTAIFKERSGGVYGKNGAVLHKPAVLIDPFNGWDDLCSGTIRVIGEMTFESDAARLMRAVRLAAELDFTIDSDTEILIKQYCHLIAGIAGERVREEMLRILAVAGAGRFLDYLDRLGLLTAVIPELAPAKGVDQPKLHCWDVFDHSIQTVNALDFILRQGPWEYGSEAVLAAVPWSDVLSQYFDLEISRGSSRRALLKLAALLHDIAKPQTKTINADGRVHFLKHAAEGVAIAASILERLRFSTKEIKLVETAIRHHLRPIQMSRSEIPSNRAVYRYFRDTGEASIGILFLCLADHLAARGPYLDMAQWREHAQMTEYVLDQYFKEASSTAPLRLINGHDLINTFGMKPGPKIGEFLELAQEAQAVGELATREEALDYIDNLLAHSQDASLYKSQ